MLYWVTVELLFKRLELLGTKKYLSLVYFVPKDLKIQSYGNVSCGFFPVIELNPKQAVPCLALPAVIIKSYTRTYLTISAWKWQ